MAVTNVTLEDPRNNFIFCYTDDYLPLNSTVSVRGTNVKQSFVFTSSEGWNPSVGAFSQGVIGFEYNPNTFILGDTFVISNSSGDSTISNYGPLPSDNLNLYYDAGLYNSFPTSGTTWFDISSGGTYTGVLSSLSGSGPTWSTDNGGCILFDGIDDFVSVNNSSGLDFENKTFTVSVWIKTNTLNSAYIIAKDVVFGGWGITINTKGFAVFNAANNTGNTAFTRTSNTYISDNVWHNIVAVVTTSTSTIASNTVSIYIDGGLSNGTLTQSRVYSGSPSTLINLSRTGPGSTYYTGYIANVQIWDKGLTAAQIFQNYNALSQRFVLGNSLVANGLVTNLDAGNAWSLSQNSTTWKDTSGNGNNGTLTSGPLYSIVNGGCVNFDGSNDYVTGSMSNLSDWTVCLWFNSSDITSADVFYPFSGTATATGIGFGGTLDSTVENKWYFNDGTNTINSGSTTVTTNTWYYLVVTKSSTTYNLYTNGILTTTSTGVNLTLTQFNLGRRGDAAKYAKGKIGMLTIYNRALTYSEVSKNYFNTTRRFGSYPDVIQNTNTSNLLLNVDATNRQSYFGSGSVWSDISGTGTNYTQGGTIECYSNLFNSVGACLYNPGADSGNYFNFGNIINGRVDFTVGAWVAPNSYRGSFNFLMGTTNFGGAFDGALQMIYQGPTGPFPRWITFSFRGNGGLDSFSILPTANSIELNKWVYYVITRNSTTAPYWKLYRNAVIDAQSNYYTTYPVTNSLVIGSYASGGTYAQVVSQVHVYDKELSAAAILNIYNNTKSKYGL